MSKNVGVDTGGTFTDLVAIDEEGTVEVAKCPSRPKVPVKAFEGVISKASIPYPEISRLVYGTTVATNAVIQREGANVIFITTAGFEDIPFIQRMNRKEAYNLQWLKSAPLVRRRNCLGAVERIDAEGKVIVSLTKEALNSLLEAVVDRHQTEPIEAIAVCLLFSYINPRHELEIGNFLSDHFSGISISLSHEVAPLWREYERSSTVITDAFVKPLISQHSGELLKVLKKGGTTGPGFFLKSDGGIGLLANAVNRPVELVLSGLAGGVVGGKYFAKSAGLENAITFDMGGTSCDVGLISDGQQNITTEFEIEWGLPIAIPAVDIQTLGAGGGSIAWIDKGGMLNVGPQSAGAVPGPACYGKGNSEATITDANLVLGRLNPRYFLGGEMPLVPELAQESVNCIARRMGVSLFEAAASIVEIASENMANTIRLMTVGRGLDPKEYALIAFGGAGPLHAGAVARKLGIKKVLVPPHPGVCSAFGAAFSDLRVERFHTLAQRGDAITDEAVREKFRALAKEAEEELRAQGYRGTLRKIYMISMRYHGQNYEQDLEYDFERGLDSIFQAFHHLHHKLYGYHFAKEVIELVHVKVLVLEKTEEEDFIKVGFSVNELQQHGVREIYHRGGQVWPSPIYRRENLPTGTQLVGPLIVEEMDSTTFVPPDARIEVDSKFNLVIELD